ETLKRYRDALVDAPRELTMAFVLMQDKLQVRAVWTGSTAGAEAAMAQLGGFPGAVPDPKLDMTFVELQRASDDLLPWGGRYYSKGGFFGAMDDGVIEAMTEPVASMPVPLEVYCLQLGGAVCDVDEDATAYSGRAGAFYWISQGVWQRPE